MAGIGLEQPVGLLLTKQMIKISTPNFISSISIMDSGVYVLCKDSYQYRLEGKCYLEDVSDVTFHPAYYYYHVRGYAFAQICETCEGGIEVVHTLRAITEYNTNNFYSDVVIIHGWNTTTLLLENIYPDGIYPITPEEVGWNQGDPINGAPMLLRLHYPDWPNITSPYVDCNGVDQILEATFTVDTSPDLCPSPREPCDPEAHPGIACSGSACGAAIWTCSCNEDYENTEVENMWALFPECPRQTERYDFDSGYSANIVKYVTDYNTIVATNVPGVSVTSFNERQFIYRIDAMYDEFWRVRIEEYIDAEENIYHMVYLISTIWCISFKVINYTINELNRTFLNGEAPPIGEIEYCIFDNHPLIMIGGNNITVLSGSDMGAVEQLNELINNEYSTLGSPVGSFFMLSQ